METWIYRRKLTLLCIRTAGSGPVFCISSEQLIETDGQQEVLYEAKPLLLTSGQVICMSFVLANKQYIHVDLYVCQTNNILKNTPSSFLHIDKLKRVVRHWRTDYNHYRPTTFFILPIQFNAKSTAMHSLCFAVDFTSLCIVLCPFANKNAKKFTLNRNS